MSTQAQSFRQHQEVSNNSHDVVPGKITGNYVGLYENQVDTRPEAMIDEELVSKQLDFQLKIGNDYAGSIHRKTLTTKFAFFTSALEQFHERLSHSR